MFKEALSILHPVHLTTIRLTNKENLPNYIIRAFKSIDILQFIYKFKLLRPFLFKAFIFKTPTKSLGSSHLEKFTCDLLKMDL